MLPMIHSVEMIGQRSAKLEQLFDNLLQLSNSTHSGKYVLPVKKYYCSLSAASTDPADPGYYRIAYHGGSSIQNSSELKVEIGANSVIDINIIRTSINTDGEAEDQLFMPIFGALSELINDLDQGMTDKLGAEHLEALEAALDGV